MLIRINQQSMPLSIYLSPGDSSFLSVGPFLLSSILLAFNSPLLVCWLELTVCRLQLRTFSPVTRSQFFYLTIKRIPSRKCHICIVDFLDISKTLQLNHHQGKLFEHLEIDDKKIQHKSLKTFKAQLQYWPSRGHR